MRDADGSRSLAPRAGRSTSRARSARCGAGPAIRRCSRRPTATCGGRPARRSASAPSRSGRDGERRDRRTGLGRRRAVAARSAARPARRRRRLDRRSTCRAYPGLAEVARRHPGLRLPVVRAGCSRRSCAAVLEQRVTGSRPANRGASCCGASARRRPGRWPGSVAPPDAATLLDITTWDWHRLGVEAARQRPIRAAATAIVRASSAAIATPC